MSLNATSPSFNPISSVGQSFQGLRASDLAPADTGASPFGQDGVSLSEEAFQVAEATPTVHLNSVLAIQAAQANPGAAQQYKHGANGNPGTVTWVNGDFKWK